MCCQCVHGSLQEALVVVSSSILCTLPGGSTFSDEHDLVLGSAKSEVLKRVCVSDSTGVLSCEVL